MVCGNGCKASVVGRWEGVKRCLIPCREKELCCNCQATRGQDSRWQIQSAVGTLVFRWAPHWMGRASSCLGNFPENPETKGCSQSNQSGQRCHPPRLPPPPPPSHLLCVTKHTARSLVCRPCLWIKTVVFYFVIEDDREELRWASQRDDYFCRAVFDLICERGLAEKSPWTSVSGLRRLPRLLPAVRQRKKSQQCKGSSGWGLGRSDVWIGALQFMIQAWLRIYIASSYSYYPVNSHFLHPLPVRACTHAQTYAVVHNSTVGAENGKPVSCDGKTECIISICMEWRRGAAWASQPRRISGRTMRLGGYTIADYS